MPPDKNDLLQYLKFELDFLEQGGYGRSVRTPWQATSTFQDSPSCLNFDDPARPHPCTECLLMRFVPAASRGEAVPCHHIPIGPRGETIEDLEGNRPVAEEALRNWLKSAIAQVEAS
jgi:hypothetical protein